MYIEPFIHHFLPCCKAVGACFLYSQQMQNHTTNTWTTVAKLHCIVVVEANFKELSFANYVDT